jgi:hypothetical protein
MKTESPERLAALSARARDCFAGGAPHLRIEALYHRFITQPEEAQRECEMLYRQWKDSGLYEALSALGVALEELLTAGLPLGIVRGSALYYLARIRYDFQPLSVTVLQAREALVEFQGASIRWFIFAANDLLADVLYEQGDLPGGLKGYRDSIAIIEKLANQDPSNTGWQRDLSESYEKVGDIESELGSRW